jgi:tetratricopeptide (TPR) repeat protein
MAPIQEKTPRRKAMPRRLFVLAANLFLVTATLRAESPGERELALGRQSLARRDYGTAAEHLAAATAALDPQKERDALAEAWLQLGVADLTGLDRPEDALAAFRKSAGLSGSPSAWLWASTAAEKLGRAEEARDYKARAIGSPQPPVTLEAAPAPPPPTEPAAEKKPDAFQHFFGPKEPAEPPAAAPVEAAPAEPVKKGDAFQHLFGESSPAEKKPAKKLEKKKEEKTPAAQAATPKVDAFQHFFGEKKKDGPAGDESKGEKKEGAQDDKKTPEESSAPPPL